MTAFEILESLQTEIGARRAGTEGERRVQEWLKAYSEKLGLFVEMNDFTFIGNEKYRPVLMMVMFTIMAGSNRLSLAGRPITQVGWNAVISTLRHSFAKISGRFHSRHVSMPG